MQKFYGFLLLLTTTVLLGAEGDRVIRNPNQDKDIKIQVNKGGVDTDSVVVDGATGVVSFPSGASGVGGGNAVNLLKDSNADFELGNVSWTASTPANFTIETVSPISGFGPSSGSFDATAASETLESEAVTGLVGLQCLVKFYYQYTGTSGDYTVTVHDASDNDLILDTDGAVFDLSDTDGATRSFEAGFPCDSGAMNIQIASTSASSGDLVVDGVWLGQDYRLGSAGNAEVVLQLAYNENASGTCLYETASGNFPQVITNNTGTCDQAEIIYKKYEITNTADRSIPAAQFPYLPPGIYEVTLAGSPESDAASACQMTQGITDDAGVTTRGEISMSNFGGTANSDMALVSVGVFEYTTGGARQFDPVIGCNNASTQTYNLNNNASIDTSLIWTIKRYPLSSVDTVTLETQGWFVNAQIEGSGNITMPIVDTAESVIDDSGLTLTNLGGSATARIACEGAASEGSTCTGDEVVGFAANFPRAGEVEICYTFSNQIQFDAASERLISQFKIVLTENDSDTSISDHGNLTQNRNGTSVGSEEETRTIAICDIYAVVAGENTSKLLNIVSGVQNTPTTNNILATGSASGGNISITAKYITQNFPQAVAFVDATPETKGIYQGNLYEQGRVYLRDGDVTPTGDTINITASAATVNDDASWIRPFKLVGVDGTESWFIELMITGRFGADTTILGNYAIDGVDFEDFANTRFTAFSCSASRSGGGDRECDAYIRMDQDHITMKTTGSSFDRIAVGGTAKLQSKPTWIP